MAASPLRHGRDQRGRRDRGPAPVAPLVTRPRHRRTKGPEHTASTISSSASEPMSPAGPPLAIQADGPAGDDGGEHERRGRVPRAQPGPRGGGTEEASPAKSPPRSARSEALARSARWLRDRSHGLPVQGPPRTPPRCPRKATPPPRSARGECSWQSSRSSLHRRDSS